MPPIVLMGVFLPLLYPDGRLLSPAWRWVARVAAADVVLGVLLLPLKTGPVRDVRVPLAENPVGVEALDPVIRVLALPIVLLVPVCFLLAAASMVIRFVRSSGVERLQLKWLTSAVAFIATWATFLMMASVPQMVDPTRSDPRWLVFMQNIEVLSYGLLPVAIGIAITRHGLFGIDRLLSRALLVGVLGLSITGLYVAIVVGVGAVVGQRAPSDVLAVIATVVVAVTFQPLRARLQRAVNRLVYGDRATPYEVLSDFASRMAGRYTTAELLPQITRTLSQCLGGAQVAVWLRDGDVLVPDVCWPAWTRRPEPVTLVAGAPPELSTDRVEPVRHHDELLGVLTVTKPAGEPMTSGEDQLVAHVASQTGLVLRNVRLVDDLRSSRQRLLLSQETERRRLERDLHDGAQQSLVAVALMLRMAEGRDQEALRATVEEASVQLQHAIDELRELARGIHPAILTDRGLGPALTSLVERCPVPVEEVNGVRRRLPSAVEGTLYFVAAEALTNVAKYARAGVVRVELTDEGDRVRLLVEDDGIGGADPSRGSGLLGLADRVAVVDGTLVVDSATGSGTRIVCTVPVDAPAPAPARVEPAPAPTPALAVPS
jgi:signal transduction histidine kinase